MNVKTVHMKDIFKQNDDLYTSAMIIAKRAKQIIDDRVVPIEENEEVEDSMEFDRPIISNYEEKPEAIALPSPVAPPVTNAFFPLSNFCE